MRWLTVDLPEAIRVRESFLTPTERFHHQAISALDPQWMESVDASRGVFIIAQGLLMYLQPEAVEQLFVLLAERFPGAEMAFDIVPRSLSAATLAGLEQTPDYRLPAMPWGLNRQEIGPMLRRWSPHLSRLKFLPYRWSGRWPAPVEGFLDATLRRRSDRPSLVHLTL
jgi:O-methyltransferase involved in polyketide biosynthesis